MSRSQPAKAKQDLAAENTAQAAKEIARDIRQAAMAARATVKTFRDSGAIEEIAEAAREAAIAARDTTVEIRDAARDLSKAVGETTGAVKETAAIAQDAASAVAREVPKPRSGRKSSRPLVPKSAARNLKRGTTKARRQRLQEKERKSKKG